MDLLSVIIAALVVIILYLVAEWALGMLKISYPKVLLQVLALLLFLLILLGRINLGL